MLYLFGLAFSLQVLPFNITVHEKCQQDWAVSAKGITQEEVCTSSPNDWTE